MMVSHDTLVSLCHVAGECLLPGDSLKWQPKGMQRHPVDTIPQWIDAALTPRILGTSSNH
jgi:hypothetical protein